MIERSLFADLDGGVRGREATVALRRGTLGTGGVGPGRAVGAPAHGWVSL
jgi:hypothetical protein